MLDYLSIILWGLGVVCTVLGWFAKSLHYAVQNLAKDVAALEVQINRDYVRYDRLKDAFEPVMIALHEIKETLKTKVDK